MAYPYGEEPLQLKSIERITQLAVQRSGDILLLAALDIDGELLLQSYNVEDDAELTEPATETLVTTTGNIDFNELRNVLRR